MVGSWKMKFPFGANWAYFQGLEAVSFREFMCEVLSIASSIWVDQRVTMEGDIG